MHGLRLKREIGVGVWLLLRFLAFGVPYVYNFQRLVVYFYVHILHLIYRDSIDSP